MPPTLTRNLQDIVDPGRTAKGMEYPFRGGICTSVNDS